MKSNVIEVNDLTKDYGNGKGIFSVDLSVEEGEIYGFLGPNGAGKSTTIRHLLGFIQPQQGKCQVLGMDCFAQAGEIQKHLGYLAGEIAFMDDMNGRDLLNFLTEMKGIKDIRKREDLLERFELDPSGKVKKMSKGMKQKIGIISAFMADPEVIILDEPTSGLDPLMQNRFVELLLEEKKKGRTILMSSHIFEEIEKTCDRTAIIRAGKIVTVEDMESLAEKKQKEYEITFINEKECQRFLTEQQGEEEFVRRNMRPSQSEQNGDSVEISHIQKFGKTILLPEAGDLQKLFGTLSQYQIQGLDVRKQTLEELFMHFYDEKETK